MVIAAVAEEDACPEIPFRMTGLAIRHYLMTVGAGSPYDFWKCYRRVKPGVKYQSVWRYFWYLRRLGLIERVGEEERPGGVGKVYYRIVPGMEDDEAWYAPQATLYPITRLGSRRYRRLKERERG